MKNSRVQSDNNYNLQNIAVEIGNQTICFSASTFPIAMATDPETPLSKRRKTLALDPDSPLQSPISLISKGKSKIEEESLVAIEAEVDDLSADSCGICFSEAGNGGVSRGYIDCCEHYFCFLCIMEWAKVESKCPLCKRRFSTIRRPAKPPVFASDRVIQIPVRDQVYHYFGNATMGPPDPYSDVKCSVCLSVADECLTLLCDLCDSAVHTYCVGLGVTVPEGDWFCQDCTLLRDEHAKTETGSKTEVLIRSNAIQMISSADEHISVFDIVREEEPPVSEFSRSGNDESAVANTVDESSLMIPGTPKYSSKPNTRTLQHRRRLNSRICVMRENWNGIRSGILRFSSSMETSKACSDGLRLASCVKQVSPARCGSSSLKIDDEEEIKKAWKMMDKAKSIVHQPSKHPICRPDVFRNCQNVGYGEVFSDSRSSVSKNNVARVGSRHQPLSAVGGSANSPSLRHVKPEACKVFEAPSQNGCPKIEKQMVVQGQPACLSSSFVSESMSSDADHAGNSHKSSSSQSKPNHRRLNGISSCSQQCDEAKREVQSLVKHDLKRQTKGEKLEFDAFKKVARLATHSILAACGLEDPKPGLCSIPDFTCSHLNDICRLRKSGLMPNCCRECFSLLVRGMVDAAVFQKKTG